MGLLCLKHLSDTSRRKQGDVAPSGAINQNKSASLQISEVRRSIFLRKRSRHSDTVNPRSVVTQWHVIIPCLSATREDFWAVYHKTFHWALSVLTHGPGATNKPSLSLKQCILTLCESLGSFETPQKVHVTCKTQNLGKLKVYWFTLFYTIRLSLLLGSL